VPEAFQALLMKGCPAVGNLKIMILEEVTTSNQVPVVLLNSNFYIFPLQGSTSTPMEKNICVFNTFWTQNMPDTYFTDIQLSSTVSQLKKKINSNISSIHLGHLSNTF